MPTVNSQSDIPGTPAAVPKIDVRAAHHGIFMQHIMCPNLFVSDSIDGQ